MINRLDLIEELGMYERGKNELLSEFKFLNNFIINNFHKLWHGASCIRKNKVLTSINNEVKEIHLGGVEFTEKDGILYCWNYHKYARPHKLNEETFQNIVDQTIILLKSHHEGKKSKLKINFEELDMYKETIDEVLANYYELDQWVLKHFMYLFKGAVHLGEGYIYEDYYAPKRIQTKHVRFHENGGLKIIDDFHYYKRRANLSDRHLELAIKDIKMLMEAYKKSLVTTIDMKKEIQEVEEI